MLYASQQHKSVTLLIKDNASGFGDTGFVVFNATNSGKRGRLRCPVFQAAPQLVLDGHNALLGSLDFVLHCGQ